MRTAASMSDGSLSSQHKSRHQQCLGILCGVRHFWNFTCPDVRKICVRCCRQVVDVASGTAALLLADGRLPLLERPQHPQIWRTTGVVGVVVEPTPVLDHICMHPGMCEQWQFHAPECVCCQMRKGEAAQKQFAECLHNGCKTDTRRRSHYLQASLLFGELRTWRFCF